MLNGFNSGPFSIDPAGKAGSMLRWTMRYGHAELAVRTLPAEADRAAIIEAFSEPRAAFVLDAERRFAPARISLIDEQSGDEIGHFYSHDACEMTPGIVDNRSRYWIRSADRRRSRPVSLSMFAQIAAEHAAPAASWIAGMLAEDVLTRDPEGWRAPTAWEIRHIVGEGSFTRISGAKAAALVGVTPQNFRKYTAADDAATRQRISFSMWHLLLHKFGVQRA